MGPRFARFVLNLQISHLIPQLVNHVNELNVIIHDAQVIFLMHLTLFLQPFLQSVHRVFEELLLVIILSFDIRVDFDVSYLPVLHILFIKAAVDRTLK